MKPPLFVRPLSDAERAALRQGLRCAAAFTRRRCRLLLQSDQSQRPSQIASSLGCSAQAVRNTLRAFTAEGLACLHQKPSRPKTIHSVWPKSRDGDLRALLRLSPSSLGKPAHLWTLQLVAHVCFEKGWTARLLSRETIRLVLKRLDIAWKRARPGPGDPEPHQTRANDGASTTEVRRQRRRLSQNRQLPPNKGKPIPWRSWRLSAPALRVTRGCRLPMS